MKNRKDGIRLRKTLRGEQISGKTIQINTKVITEGKNKFKTIFKIQDSLLTAVKVEKPEFIYVLTLWEANEEEAEKWKKK